MNQGRREESTVYSLRSELRLRLQSQGLEDRQLSGLEHLSLLQSTHIIDHNLLNSSSGDPMPSSGFYGHRAHIHSCRQKPFIHTKLNKSGKKIESEAEETASSEQAQGPEFDSQHPYSTHIKSHA